MERPTCVGCAGMDKAPAGGLSLRPVRFETIVTRARVVSVTVLHRTPEGSSDRSRRMGDT